jgi:hypothetical protein
VTVVRGRKGPDVVELLIAVGIVVTSIVVL